MADLTVFVDFKVVSEFSPACRSSCQYIRAAVRFQDEQQAYLLVNHLVSNLRLLECVGEISARVTGAVTE